MSRSTVLLSGLAVLLLAALWYGSRRERNPAPPLDLAQPELVATKEGYVGAAACKQCHRKNADAWDTSGHAHTFHASVDSRTARDLAGTEFKDPQRGGMFRYHFDQQGLAVSLPDRFGAEQFPLTHALGSGTHAVTFLTLLPHQDGGVVGLEHRATWYHELGALGLTVGHRFLGAPKEDAEHFGKVLDRKKLTECIGCHTTHAKVDSPEIRELIPQVGCERCHGPGRDHVAARSQGLIGPDISTKKRWPTALAEIRTCGACHRLAESLKPTELVRSSRVLPRFQPAGLMQSRCYTESRSELRCTTCHNPHAKTSTDRSAYERTCLDCHQRQTVAACPQGTTGCVDCHMPRVEFEGVAGFHDHWIRIRNSKDDPSPQLPATTAPAP